MADNTIDETVPTPDLNKLNEALSKAQEFNSKFEKQLKDLKKNADLAGTNLSSAFDPLLNIVSSGKRGMDQATESAKKLANTASLMQGNMSSVSNIDMSKFTNSMSGSLNGFTKMASEVGKTVTDMATKVVGNKNVLGAAGSVLGSSLMEGLKKEIYTAKIPATDISFDEVQKKLTELDKTALTTGQNFTGSFEGSVQSVNAFRKAFADTLTTTKASEAQINEVNRALSEFMDMSKATGTINNLTKSITGINAALSPTNASILIATATGQSYSDVAKQMGELSYDLGEDLEGAAKAFGRIKQATDGTGVGFATASKSILNAANSLKFFGGTVNSVAPLFSAFAGSLKDSGIGRQGLTPELLSGFVEGLRNMSLSSRAFLSLQTTRTTGQSALQGGLQMEAALEDKTGKGMEKVLSNIVGTLKQYGGGKVLTREEGQQSAQAAQQYILQRQLLEKMGIARGDVGQQNKVMEMLKGVSEKGFNINDKSTGELQELLGAGQKTAEATNTDLQKAQNATTSAVVSSGDKIVAAIKGGTTGTSMQKALSAIDKNLESAARKGGITNPEKFLKDVGLRDKMMTDTGKKGFDVEESKKAALSANALADSIIKEAKGTYNKNDKDYASKTDALIKQKMSEKVGQLKNMNLQTPYSQDLIKNLESYTGGKFNQNKQMPKTLDQNLASRNLIDNTQYKKTATQMDDTIKIANNQRNKEIQRSITMSQDNKINSQNKNNPVNQENTRDEKQKKMELGLDVKIVNGTVKIDKQYIKEVVSETYRRGIE